MSETFKKSWRGWVRSSEGYQIRMLGRTGIDYRDDKGQIRIDAESMSAPANEIIVFSGSIADGPDRSKTEVLDRLRRAFEFAGWILTVEEAWFD